MDERKSELVAKVPHVTLLFWIITILATTLGETGGDAVTMSWLGETTSRSAAFGTVSQTQSGMQSTLQSFKVVHIAH